MLSLLYVFVCIVFFSLEFGSKSNPPTLRFHVMLYGARTYEHMYEKPLNRRSVQQERFSLPVTSIQQIGVMRFGYVSSRTNMHIFYASHLGNVLRSTHTAHTHAGRFLV